MSDKHILAEVMLHWKQGDEFADLLENHDGNVAAAFGVWAQIYRDRMDQCQRLAETLRGLNVIGVGDGSYASIEAGDATADAVLTKLISSGDLLQAELDDHESEFERPMMDTGDEQSEDL